ncbi:hypothetical protein RclHR1_00880015 [Rhizophagus clarus]|uniref:Uncharacterized protein n=1 Tax=Rhizophagus clarus TaxID=94130 RepID=A0A2Z6R0I0_9GLOM|nr:hypothetical protein RclHR1_02530020 [Rhizophagus clarus]GBC09361.1 hypothetical protein RclHR1_00880015 [Rhizophagus clarus]GES83835.1 hypothetical protein GLOIN_2v1792454 [Rhizophagus clarus]
MDGNQINSKKKQGPKPQWYQHLINTIIISPGTLQLSITLPSLLMQVINSNRPKVKRKLNASLQKVKNAWLAYWDVLINDMVIGKILEYIFISDTKTMIYIEHWLPFNMQH